jgi:hypothetical protein
MAGGSEIRGTSLSHRTRVFCQFAQLGVVTQAQLCTYKTRLVTKDGTGGCQAAQEETRDVPARLLVLGGHQDGALRQSIPARPHNPSARTGGSAHAHSSVSRGLRAPCDMAAAGSRLARESCAHVAAHFCHAHAAPKRQCSDGRNGRWHITVGVNPARGCAARGHASLRQPR